MNTTETIGWAASIVLLMTVGRQVYTQWKSGECAGVSRWLFAGQIVASIGFVIYSWLVGNWVFVTTNLFMFVTACLGQYLFLRSKSVVETIPTTAGIKLRVRSINTSH